MGLAINDEPLNDLINHVDLDLQPVNSTLHVVRKQAFTVMFCYINCDSENPLTHETLLIICMLVCLKELELK